MTGPEYVTETACQDRHRSTKWLTSSILVVVIAILGVSGWCALASHQAIGSAQEANYNVQAIRQVSEERHQDIHRALERLQSGQDNKIERIDILANKGPGQ